MKKTLFQRIIPALLALILCLTACTQIPPVPIGTSESSSPSKPTEPSDPTDPSQPSVPTQTVSISEEALYDKIAGSWIAQMIGVTWAATTEFVSTGAIIPESGVPQWNNAMFKDGFWQDDVYVEIPFLDAMKEYGVNATIEQIAPYFRDSEFPLWHANYQGRLNLRNGIEPSLAGHYQYNSHADDIDWQIEADFLGNIYPGLLTESANRAFEIGHLMNYGDGVYGGVFMSVMHSAALVYDDLDKIIEIGITSIPEGTEFRMVMDQVMECYEAGKTWEQCWNEIEVAWGTDDKCLDGRGAYNIDAKLNAAYVLMGLLWGEGDFAQTTIISMRCGQDSDCNPSSAAAILGTMYGLSGIPEEYLGGVDYDTHKFAYTDYTLRACIQLNLELAKQALDAAGATLENGVYTFEADVCAAPVPYEQWPDDVLTIYLEVNTDQNGRAHMSFQCVPPKGFPEKDVVWTLDMGDGTVLNYAGSVYQYSEPGTYTITCTATAGDKTATATRQVVIEEIWPAYTFKVTPSASELDPQGGGSDYLSVICDGFIPFASDTDSQKQQYDTFNYTYTASDWFSLEFDRTVEIDAVRFTEGMHFGDGGWFKTTPEVQLLIGGRWQTAELAQVPNYPQGNSYDAHGEPYESFLFVLQSPVACEGVRIIGPAGGNNSFISCSELDVRVTDVPTGDVTPDTEDDILGQAEIIVSVTEPWGGGSRDKNILRDGIASDATQQVDQYDTYVGSVQDQEDYYGYIFRSRQTVKTITFTEGMHYADGGWFKNGSIHVELLIGGQWVDAPATVSPDYPNGDDYALFGANFESYTFTLLTPTACDGLRITGLGGGNAHFTSAAEIAVTFEN